MAGYGEGLMNILIKETKTGIDGVWNNKKNNIQ